MKNARDLALAIALLAAAPVAAQPAEVPSLDWCDANRECLEWPAVPGATSYVLYRGGVPELAGLLDATTDGCRRDEPGNPSSGRTLYEAPPAGGVFWFLAIARDATGDGPAGSGSAGPRVLDSSGDCPFECNPEYGPRPNQGLPVEAPGDAGCPDGMARVDAFCVDRYEASLVRVDNGVTWSPFVHPGSVTVRAVSVADAVPQGYIDQQQASAACSNSGKRLCTDAEWLRACGGPTGTTYPYGDTYVAGACNDTRAVHPVIEYFGTTEPWIWSMLDHPCINQLPAGLEHAGTRAGCETAEGVRDMVGNLQEWTADPNGTFRGGFYVESTINGPGCFYVTTAHNVSHYDYSTGFRCCADAF